MTNSASYQLHGNGLNYDVIECLHHIVMWKGTALHQYTAIPKSVYTQPCSRNNWTIIYQNHFLPPHPIVHQHAIPTLHHLPPTLRARHNRQLRQQRNHRAAHQRRTDLGAARRHFAMVILLQKLRAHQHPRRRPPARNRPGLQVQHVRLPAADVHRRGECGAGELRGQAGVAEHDARGAGGLSCVAGAGS